MYVQKQEFDSILNDFVDSLSPIPLGEAYSSMSGTDCQKNLTRYRAKKKFAKPSKSDIERAHNSVAAMLAYDAQGITSFEPARMDIDPEVRKIIYKARLSLHELFSNFKYNTKLLDFPSGESYDSARGDVSFVAKFRDLKHLRVTPDCFDLFARVCYDTLCLKRIMKSHMHQQNVHNKRRFNDKALFEHFKGQKDFQFLIFREKLRTIVTFSYGSRLTTVPKDKDVDRVIEVECLGNMIVQRTIGNGIREIMRRFMGVDLDTSQPIHRMMIKFAEFATVDLSNASNSNWFAVIKWFLPKRIFSLLNRSRAAVVSYNGEYHGLNMLSPMGNGFTFEVMSVVLLALCRVLDPLSRVFGDDIIIRNQFAEKLIEALQVCGYQINEKKTFINSPFRESCGAFYHDEIGYITAYDFHYPSTDFDRMVLINKIWRISQVDDEFKVLHSKLLRLFDSLALRSRDSLSPESITSNAFLTTGVVCSISQLKKHKTRNATKMQKKLARFIASPLVKECQKNLQYRRIDVVCLPELLTRSYKGHPVHLAGNNKWVWFAFYLRNGVITPKIRQTYEVKRLRMILSSTLL